jgi:hypothetical protein
MKPRKTTLRRSSKLQRKILVALGISTKEDITTPALARVLGLPASPYASKLSDSIRLLIEKGLVKRKRYKRMVLVPYGPYRLSITHAGEKALGVVHQPSTPSLEEYLKDPILGPPILGPQGDLGIQCVGAELPSDHDPPAPVGPPLTKAELLQLVASVSDADA